MRKEDGYAPDTCRLSHIFCRYFRLDVFIFSLNITDASAIAAVVIRILLWNGSVLIIH